MSRDSDSNLYNDVTVCFRSIMTISSLFYHHFGLIDSEINWYVFKVQAKVHLNQQLVKQFNSSFVSHVIRGSFSKNQLSAVLDGLNLRQNKSGVFP